MSVKNIPLNIGAVPIPGVFITPVMVDIRPRRSNSLGCRGSWTFLRAYPSLNTPAKGTFRTGFVCCFILHDS
jgi:hypothetical protein